MPEIPDVVSGTPVASSWGNDIRDRVLQRYADSSELASQSPFPAPGELAYLDDTGEALLWNGAEWLPIARVNYQSLLMYGDSQGYWLRPDPADNTKDWRLVGAGDTVLLQSRAGGSFQTVEQWPKLFVTTGNPVDSTTLSGAGQNLGPRLTIAKAGLWRVTQAGFMESSTSANITVILRARTGGGTPITEMQGRTYGSISTTQRVALSTTTLYQFSGANTLQLDVFRNELQGTNLMRRWQLTAEWVQP